MKVALTAVGIDVVNDLPSGTHYCLFYETRQDLLDVLVPYFKAGLERGEFCLWALSDLLTEDEAWDALRKGISELDTHRTRQSIQVVPGSVWYGPGGAFDPQAFCDRWRVKLDEALARGYIGLRGTGDECIANQAEWSDFCRYEGHIDRCVVGSRMVLLCTYQLEHCGAAQLLDVVQNHQQVATMRGGIFGFLESPELKTSKAELAKLNEELERKIAENVAAVDELYQEIAERKRLEEVLQSAEQRFRRHFELGLIGMAITSPEMRCIEVNDEICEILGYSREELLQKSWAEMTHPEDLAADLAHFNSVLAGESEGYSMEKRWIRKDGRVIDSIISVKCVRRRDESVDYFVSFLQDVTERKMAQKKIADYEERLRSLASELVLAEERERKRLAGVLHDSIAQSLIASKLRAESLAGAVSQPEVAEELQAIIQIVTRIIAATRSLMYEISHPVLYMLGLEAAIGWLVNKMLEEHGIRGNFSSDSHPKPLDEGISVLLLSAVQELISNVIKHAHVNEVTVRISRVGDTIEIVVQEEGVGFDVSRIGTNYDETGGFGLFSIRERLTNLGGEFRIVSTIGHGTTVTLIAPLAATTPPSRSA